MDAFLTRLARDIDREQLLPRKATLLLTVSGGLDSMTMLVALLTLRDQFGWRLAVAHFNHRLRGRSADADQRFVERQCAALNVRCHTGSWSAIERDAAVKKQGVEQAARNARFAFFARTAAALGARHVVTAHHADDQVELFFVRLLRGSGSRGLGGMRPRNRFALMPGAWIVRPLIGFARAEIADWAAAHRVRYREDRTNADLRFLRNRIRHKLLPFLECKFPAATRNVFLRTMVTLADEADWFRQEAALYLRTPAARRKDFTQCHPALQRQILVLQLEEQGVEFDWDVVEKLRASPEVKITSPGNHQISRDPSGRLRFHAPTSAGFTGVGAFVYFEGSTGKAGLEGLRISWSRTTVKRRPVFGAGRELFDADAVGGRVLLRHWKPGDRFQPIGMKQPVKLQDLFTNAKISREERHQTVLATTAAGEIFWVEGLRIGERFKLTSRTEKCLVWRWRRASKNGR